MEDFGMAPASSTGLISLLQDVTRNDNSHPSQSSYQSIADDTLSHPEDIPSILTAVFSSLKSPAKDWRKINKTLGLILSLLRFGNFSLLEEFKKKANVFHELMEFFFVENRLDKGGVVRDKARVIYFMLNTPGSVENERESIRRGSDRTPASTGWGNEGHFERKAESERRPENSRKLFQEERRVVHEPQKPNVFAGVNVKAAPLPRTSKAVVEKDLLDYSEPQPMPVKASRAPQDLLLMEDFSVPAPSNVKPTMNDLLLDLPLVGTGERSLVNEKKSEIQQQEKKYEPKIVANLSGQGMSMNSLKTTPSFQSAPAPKPQSPPKSLESRLLNLDGLCDSLTEAKPKPPPRNYF